MISQSKDNVFSYPAGFYTDTTPAAKVWVWNTICECANSLAEADALFDYTNTVNARNAVMVSEHETAKYYERIWYSGKNERIYKCGFTGFQNNGGIMSLIMPAVNPANVKEFAEFWILNSDTYQCYSYPPTYGIADILSSAVTDSAGEITSDIYYLSFTPGADWCLCDYASTNTITTHVSKLDGLVTFTMGQETYYPTGTGVPCSAF
jgi:hypothetical protein